MGNGENREFSNWDHANPSGNQDQHDDSENDHSSTDLYTLMRKLDIAEHIPALQVSILF